MITNQNHAYASLFATASQALNITNPDEYISSLNEYFAAIEDLAQIDLKFTILPLDEETFDIDANSRTITVPPSFKHGVGVKGDQVAEIIYFKIDRYFDATDLNTQNIYIEWENAKGEQGLSKEYVRDITTDPDHIIFGWPLASQITEYAGAIKFAVRFYSFKDPTAAEKEIVYSFATQPQTIMINNTMDFAIADEGIQRLEDDVIDMIKARFQNSEKDDVTTDVPAPTFLLNLTTGEYDVYTKDTYDEDPNSYALQAQAVGSGNVTYVLKKAAPGSNIWVSQDSNTVKIDYRQTQDTTRNPSKIYYIPVEKEGVLAYEVYPSEFDADSNQGIYEQYCFAFVSAPGDYLIQAKNRVGISSKSLDSNRVTFPQPVAPVINTEVIGVLLDKNNQATLNIEYLEARPKGEYTYNWTGAHGTIPEANGDSITITTDAEESIYHVTVTNRRNNESVTSGEATYRVTKPAQIPEILAPIENSNVAVGTALTIEVKTEGVPFDDIQVQWYKSIDLNMDNLENDVSCSEIISAKTGAASFTPTEGGLYYAKVTLKRNIDEATAISPTWSVIG